MKNADVPLAIVCPCTIVSSTELDCLTDIFGGVGLLETAFTQAETLPDNVVSVPVFSESELVEIRKMVASMTEMGQNDSSNLRYNWHLNEPFPPLMPAISSLADEIRHGEKGEKIENETEPPTEGVLLSLLEEWDRDQLDLTSRFRAIADSEKKLFQELLATETGLETRIQNGTIEIDLGSYQTGKRICAWLDCADRVKEKIPTIWVTTSQSVKNWLLQERWVYESTTLGTPKDLGVLNSKQNFWKTLASFPTHDYATNITDSTGKKITLWKVQDPIRTRIKKGVVFCWIELDG